MADKRLYGREFLNPDEGIAAIESIINIDEDGDYITGTLTLSDCNRRVDLDFDLSSWHDGPDKLEKMEADCERRLNKLKRLVGELKRFERAYVKAVADFKKTQTAKLRAARLKPAEPQVVSR